MNNKIFIAFLLLVFLGSALLQSQQFPYSQKWKTKKILGERSERRDHIFNQTPVSMNTPAHQPLSKDKANKLNAIIPDFQVNENAVPN